MSIDAVHKTPHIMTSALLISTQRNQNADNDMLAVDKYKNAKHMYKIFNENTNSIQI